MSVVEIIKKLRESNIEIAADGGCLRVRGNKRALKDSALLELVRQNKNELIETLVHGEHLSSAAGLVTVPPNLIPEECSVITPEMLTLAKLSQAEIDSAAASVPRGVKNVQDIYPLAPLQEGILFHHILEKTGDVYVIPSLVAVDSRERAEWYIEALQSVVDRQDILRSSFAWEGLPEPVQVVWRRAPLSAEEVKFDQAAGDVSEQLRASSIPEVIASMCTMRRCGDCSLPKIR